MDFRVILELTWWRCEMQSSTRIVQALTKTFQVLNLNMQSMTRHDKARHRREALAPL